MRKTLITTALLALLGGGAPLAFAQADHDAHHGGASAPAEADAKLAEGTVKNYVTTILQKIGVRDRTQAALRARELGLL